MDINNYYGNTFQLAELARVLEIDEDVIIHFNGIPNVDVLELADDGRLEIESGYAKNDDGTNSVYRLEVRSPFTYDSRVLLAIPIDNIHAPMVVEYAKRMVQYWLDRSGVEVEDTSFICGSSSSLENLDF